MTDRSEWHFQTWAGDTLVIYTTDDDPGDMGEPRTVEEDGVHYVAVRAALAQPAPAPDLLAAVEALRITAPSDLSAESLFYREGWDDCLHAVLALLRSAPTSREAGLDVERPEIIVLCGSTRFYDMFQAANYDLTMLGKIVLSVGFYPHSKAIHGHGEGVGHDSAEKVALDELHKRKIDLADRVYVLNVDGYIGESTRSEINYAIEHGKPVDYLETVR